MHYISVNVYLRNTVGIFLMYFCFHLSVSYLFIIDWGKHRRWWITLNFSIKTLICWFYFFRLPRHPLALWRLFYCCLFVCLFVHSFVLVLYEQRDGNISLAVCTHVSRSSWDLLIPVSLPSFVLDVLTFKWVTKCIIFLVVRLISYVKLISNAFFWIYLFTFKLLGILNRILLDVFIKWLISRPAIQLEVWNDWGICSLQARIAGTYWVIKYILLCRCKASAPLVFNCNMQQSWVVCVVNVSWVYSMVSNQPWFIYQTRSGFKSLRYICVWNQDGKVWNSMHKMQNICCIFQF